MRNFILSLILLFSGLCSYSQSTGDTIIVQSLHHGSAVRDTMVSFPSNPSLTYSKILLKYNMRCKDGKISDGSNRNRGCGEWDYSCNTYIHDDSKVDSLLSFQTSHTISNFSGDTFHYSSNPMHTYYVNYMTNTSLDSIISDTQIVVGNGTLNLKNVLPTDKASGKSQYLFTNTELNAAGVTSGNIDGLMINVTNNPGVARFLRVRIKSVSDSILNDTFPEFSGFAEVYFSNTSFSLGQNRLQFHTPYAWNGNTNLIIEFSFTNTQTAPAIEIQGHNISFDRAMNTAGDKFLIFDGLNYVETDQYKGIGGNHKRTVEAWIKTTNGDKDIVSWGRDAGGQKWNFRMDGNGRLRVEINGGFRVATTDLRDGKWHHVACAFGGSNVNQVAFYVDGVQEAISSAGAKSVNTDNVNGINLRISRGTNNRYFVGIIDDVKIWDTVITPSEMPGAVYAQLDASHPKYSGLHAYYALNEGIGSVVNDSTMNQYDATIKRASQWGRINGVDLFKEMKLGQNRPNITFLQGNYITTNTIDTVLDSVPNNQHTVISYQIYPKTGTNESDSIASTTNYYWQAGYEYVIDTNGNAIDSFLMGAQGSIGIHSMEYFRRYPMRFEIMSFVTPYGIGIDFGKAGHTWTYDITDFAPVLNGSKRLTMEWGGQWQEEMDIQFWFIVGTPPQNVLDIDQIWRVTKPSYANISQQRAYEPRVYHTLGSGKSFKIRSAITGHGQEGEFIPRNHFIDINNGAFKTTWQVWKACAANEIYPQGGTWIYDRAGWCPGAATDVKEIDLTANVTAGNKINVDYGMQTASGASNYIINNQIVTYGDPNFTLDAAVYDILSPTSAIEYSRTNYICGSPEIVIQNTGSSNLKNVDINYWINDAGNKQTYSWTGDLAFLETETVVLPGGSDLWKDMKPSGNRFFAQVENPNSGADGYAYNNGMASEFEIPDVLPEEFVIWFRTNNAANENSYYIYDEEGNELFSKTNFQNSTEYRDTIKLGTSCYQFYFYDSDGDGIDFWANNDGSGFLMFTSTSGSLIKRFEPDFGEYHEFNFTTNHPLSFEEINSLRNDVFEVYPNPAQGQFTVEISDSELKTISIYNSSGQKVDLNPDMQGNRLIYNANSLTKGIYLLSVESNGQIATKKLILN